MRARITGMLGVLCANACLPQETAVHEPAASIPLGPNQEIATFAGGCYWTMEKKFDDVTGVIDVVSGISGGPDKPFTKEQFVRGETGHMEAVQVRFDRSKISYRQLVDQFWKMIDPTDNGGQACPSLR